MSGVTDSMSGRNEQTDAQDRTGGGRAHGVGGAYIPGW